MQTDTQPQARKIALVTTSRADLSPLLPVMREIVNHPGLELDVIATGMHLADKHGASLVDLEQAGFAPSYLVPSIDGNDAHSTAQAISRGVAGFADLFETYRPDILMVLGDRFDMFPAPLAAMPYRIPVAHIHGGEVTEGAIDDAIRHSVSKMAHMHFVAADAFSQRLQQMGEEVSRITICGAPGLDNLASAPVMDRKAMENQIGIPSDAAFTLATVHPETLGSLTPVAQAEVITLAALAVVGWLVLTRPNADPGGDIIATAMEQLVKDRPETLLLENAGPIVYPNLLREASCVLGNSSSGLIEAGYFKRPVVNIGDRQTGRPMGANVITVPWQADEITAGWRKALTPEFAELSNGAPHPYGTGGAAKIITNILANTNLDDTLTVKHFNDIAA